MLWTLDAYYGGTPFETAGEALHLIKPDVILAYPPNLVNRQTVNPQGESILIYQQRQQRHFA